MISLEISTIFFTIINILVLLAIPVGLIFLIYYLIKNLMKYHHDLNDR